MAVSKKKGGRKFGAKDIKLNCKGCGTPMTVDSNVVSVTCYKCIAKASNPGVIFVDDLSPEEWRELLASK